MQRRPFMRNVVTAMLCHLCRTAYHLHIRAKHGRQVHALIIAFSASTLADLPSSSRFARSFL